MNRGIVYALSAYIFWGIHPIYWKQLQVIPSSEIVAHRIIWSLLFFVFIISTRGHWNQLKDKIRNSKKKMDFNCTCFSYWIQLGHVYLGGKCRFHY